MSPRLISAPFPGRRGSPFQIHWGVITGGYATLSIPSIDLIDGKSAFHILSEARSTGMVDTFYRVRDKNEAWLDTVSPRSLRYSKTILEGKYSVNEVVELDQAAGHSIRPKSGTTRTMQEKKSKA